MGKGYVDGASDNKLNHEPGIMPAASATGLFIFSDSPNSLSPKTKTNARRKILERR